MLSDVQIKELAPRMGIPLEGIYFKDNLPNLEINKAYIINLENQEDEEGNKNFGSHWVAFQIFKTTEGHLLPFFFDSFGFAYPKELNKASRKLTKKMIGYSARQLQDPFISGACGWYCLAWLHFMNRQTGKYFKDDYMERYLDFLEMFDEKNQAHNDNILKMFFKEAPNSEDGGVNLPNDTSPEAGIQDLVIDV